jgi:hypothetical protein
VDSKQVTKEIRRSAWSALREAGFGRQLGRSAYREWASGVDLINFQSFNSYLANGVGCTTFSFSVKLGVWLEGIPGHRPARTSKDGRPAPHDYECSVRYTVGKGLFQPFFHPYSARGTGVPVERIDVWYVEEDGENLAECVWDAVRQVQEVGLPWFEEMHDIGGLLNSWKVRAMEAFVAEGKPRTKTQPSPEVRYRDGVRLTGRTGPWLNENIYIACAWAALESKDEELAAQCLRQAREQGERHPNTKLLERANALRERYR